MNTMIAAGCACITCATMLHNTWLSHTMIALFFACAIAYLIRTYQACQDRERRLEALLSRKEAKNNGRPDTTKPR